MRRLLAICVFTLAACSPPPANVKPLPKLLAARETPRTTVQAKPTNEQVFSNGKPSERLEVKRTPSGDIAHGKYESWWPNGQMATQGHYSNGQQHGAWLGWYPNGKPEFEAHFDLGVLDGIWREWRENGSPITDGAYATGRRNGPWREYDNQGVLISQTRFENGEVRDISFGRGLQTRTETDPSGRRSVYTYRRQPRGEIVRDGSYSSWHPNEAKHEEGRYAADRPVGPWRIWYENGKKKFEGAYDEMGELSGNTLAWYANGMLDAEGEYLHGMKNGFWWHRDAQSCQITTSNFLAGYLDGPMLEQTAQGDVLRMGTYSAGEPIGRWVEFKAGQWVVSEFSHTGTSFELFDSGRVKARGKLANGKREGPWTDYYQSGTRARQADFKIGELHGKAKSWFENGKLWREALYSEGRRLGYATQWDEANLAYLRGAWDDELQVGNWKLYDWMGNELKTYKHDAREFVNLAVACDGEHFDSSLKWPNGEIESKWRVCIVEGREIRSGEVRRFHADGKLALLGQYYRGQASGEWCYFDTEGKLGSRVTYLEGDREGPFSEYYPDGSTRLQGTWRRSERLAFTLAVAKASAIENTPAAIPLDWSVWRPNFSARHGEWKWLDHTGGVIKLALYDEGRESGR